MILSIYILIIFFSWIYLYRYFKQFNILDFFLISNLLFFNLYTLITLLKHDIPNDPLIILYFNLYLFGSIFSVLFMSRNFISKKILEKIEFKEFLDIAAIVSGKKLILLLFIPTVFILYYYFKYNIIFRVPSTIVDISILNTYGIIMGSFILPLMYTILIVAISKLVQINKINIKFLYIILLLIILCYLLLYSRREFILGILIVMLSVYSIKQENTFSLKKLPILFGGLLIIMFASNLYQNIRIPLMMYSQTHELKLDKNIIEYMFDFDSSSKNIDDRMSISSYAFLVLENGVQSEKIPLGGEIIINSFLHTVPSIIYPNKKYFSEDKLISDTINIRNTDYPTNIAISFFLDFGYLSLIVFPLFIFAVIFVSLKIIAKMYKHRILYLLIIGQFIYLLFNVESSSGAYFLFFRNIIILIILLKFLNVISRFLPSAKKV